MRWETLHKPWRMPKNRLLLVALRTHRSFPTVKTHPHAIRAAEAAEAAGAQRKFWEMHDQLFTHQQALADHNLSRYARRVGLDIARFEHDMADHTYLKEIEAEYQTALFDEHVTKQVNPARKSMS
jgi:predicted DsbA family dithiol-disulfide isomerase